MNHSVNESDHESLARRLKALGHPVRLAILDALRHEPECVCHLECALSRPQPYLSQQLRVLRECGLITDERDGTNVFYRVADDVTAWLDGVMGPRALPSDSADSRTRQSQCVDAPAGRIAECPCPKCRAAKHACACDADGNTFATGNGA